MGDINLEELRKKCLASLYTCTKNISTYLVDTDKASELNKLKSCVKEYCQLDFQHNATQNAIQTITQEADLDSLEARFQEEVARNTNEHARIDHHPYMVEFENHINEAVRSQTVSEQDDLAITETQDRYIDPISKRPIRNPVRNTICNHVYEKETIENFIRSKPRKCPYVGCRSNQKIVMQHLVADEELLQQLTAQGLEDSESQ